jgi:poly-gamma-glutamate synthesis protein (capsule biosynthesis protein)
VLVPPRARELAALAVLALAAGLQAACTPAAPGATASSTPTVEPTPSATPTPPPAPVDLRLTFGGDVHFAGRNAALLDDPATAVGDFAAQLRAADFAMVNLESAVTTRGTPEPKDFHFRAPPAAYTALAAAGIDLASLANNHTLDYGRVGLTDTLDAARAANFAVVGAGQSADEAYAPYLTTVKGVRIAVIGLSQIHTLAEEWTPTATRSGVAMSHDRERSVEAVRAARTVADVVIVFMHWGVERSNCPKEEMRTFAAAMADAGATMVVGTHAHVPLAGGFLGNTYVHYGLGNFVWYINSDTVLLTLTVRAVPGAGPDRALVTGSEVTPGRVVSSGRPTPVTGDQAAAVLNRLEAAQRCARLAPAPASPVP